MSKRKQHKDWNLFLAIALISLIIFAWLLSYSKYSGDPTIEKISELGDAFGALNTLFSGLAFAGVILAIFLQQQGLELQKKELNDTKNELRKQSANQVTASKLQAYSTLLEMYQKQRDSTKTFTDERKKVERNISYVTDEIDLILEDLYLDDVSQQAFFAALHNIIETKTNLSELESMDSVRFRGQYKITKKTFDSYISKIIEDSSLKMDFQVYCKQINSPLSELLIERIPYVIAQNRKKQK